MKKVEFLIFRKRVYSQGWHQTEKRLTNILFNVNVPSLMIATKKTALHQIIFGKVGQLAVDPIAKYCLVGLKVCRSMASISALKVAV